MYWSQKLDFLSFGCNPHFQLSYLFSVSHHNYFTYPGSSRIPFFSITYATLHPYWSKEHISIKLQKLSDRKFQLFTTLFLISIFTFLTDKIIIKIIYFRRGFYVISIKKLGIVSLSDHFYHLLGGFLPVVGAPVSPFYRNDSLPLSHSL